jgi:hypothetical protein
MPFGEVTLAATRGLGFLGEDGALAHVLNPYSGFGGGARRRLVGCLGGIGEGFGVVLSCGEVGAQCWAEGQGRGLGRGAGFPQREAVVVGEVDGDGAGSW